MNFDKYVRIVPDFPKKGIMFYDVTTLFNNAAVFNQMIDTFDKVWADIKIDAIAGIDARGFIIGGALAYKMKLPFIAVRKQGKLPYQTISEKYDLEYGKETLEVHKDAVEKGASVLILDDLIATGGTTIAGIKLITRIGANIAGCGFIIDLPEIKGSTKIAEMGIITRSLISFEGH